MIPNSEIQTHYNIFIDGPVVHDNQIYTQPLVYTNHNHLFYYSEYKILILDFHSGRFIIILLFYILNLQGYYTLVYVFGSIYFIFL